MSLEVDRLRALAHPLRLQMLSLLTASELSAADVARELDTTQANASYHLRQLAAAGLLEVVREETVRGGKAKVYRHPWERGLPTATSTASRRLYLEALVAELTRRFTWRTDGRQTSTDAELWVDPEVWAEVVDMVSAASLRLHEAAVSPGADDAVHVNMTTVLFPMDQP